MAAWRVFWKRLEHEFVVVGGSGVVIWRTADLEDAWHVAELLQAARDRRNRDRRAEVEDKAVVRVHRLRSVAA